jgi:histidinol-phosphate aminotransferase
MNPLDLVREDLRAFAGYSSARRAGVSGSVWLNANESPWRSPVDHAPIDPVPALNRYPDPQPAALREALARLYGAGPEQLLVGRGSDEAIDLLVRALCRPQLDAVLVTPPVFGMYAVCARLQNAPLLEVPLLDRTSGFTCDFEQVAQLALQYRAKLVFLCSPSNPTGQALAREDVLQLARRLESSALVVVDEAYVEYADTPSLVVDVAHTPNLAVLRTLSKAHALAGARIGTLVAAPALIALLRNCQAPYPLPAPCVRLALDALAPEPLAQTSERVRRTRTERMRLSAALPALAGVRRVYPSQGNYLLARFDDAEATFLRLLAAGVVVRDMRAAPQLGDALRISIGSAEENDALLAALADAWVAA